MRVNLEISGCEDLSLFLSHTHAPSHSHTLSHPSFSTVIVLLGLTLSLAHSFPRGFHDHLILPLHSEVATEVHDAEKTLQEPVEEVQALLLHTLWKAHQEPGRVVSLQHQFRVQMKTLLLQGAFSWQSGLPVPSVPRVCCTNGKVGCEAVQPLLTRFFILSRTNNRHCHLQWHSRMHGRAHDWNAHSA